MNVSFGSLGCHWIHLAILTWCQAANLPNHAPTQEPETTAQTTDFYQPYPQVTRPETGLNWPDELPLPTFAPPADVIDTIQIQDLSIDEQLLFSALQGHVNRRRPRLMLLDARADQGRDTWLNTATLGITQTRRYRRHEKYQLLAKYADQVQGLVLYDPQTSPHYRNLAGTLGGVRGLLPVTAQVHAQLQEHGIPLEVKEDLTPLEWTSPVDIYQHLHDTIWPECEKRFLVSASPNSRGGDHHHTRDLAAACGAAVVWLDNRIPAERDLLRKFLADMPSGRSVVLGWYTTERSGITTASEFGIGTLPADHYSSATVFSGTDPEIQIPPVPQLPALQNRVYVALLISDGDNIQYTQRALRRIWDESASARGRIPLNWTMAPGLVDIGPAILNYYYTTATPQDVFVAGPSGMGYLMPVNTLEEPGATVGPHLLDPERMDAYARLTEIYMSRAGLRVVTIWDDATAQQRASYERYGRSLYGATVQNFKDMPSVASSVENNRLRFEKLEIPYTSTARHLRGSLRQHLRDWDGQAPLFLAYQVNIWSELKPERLVTLAEELQRQFPEQLEWVRADHFFNLRNQADGLPWNLMLSPEVRLTAADTAPDPKSVADGTPVSMWQAASPEEQWIQVDLGQDYQIHRYRMLHAGQAGMAADLNTRAFTLEGSLDGEQWQRVDRVVDNRNQVTDREFTPVGVRYLRLRIEDPGADGIARVADWEIYGSAVP